jgi:hypothetical protein
MVANVPVNQGWSRSRATVSPAISCTLSRMGTGRSRCMMYPVPSGRPTAFDMIRLVSRLPDERDVPPGGRSVDSSG